MTWLARLLPYLEEDALWLTTTGAYASDPLPYANPPHLGFATPIKLFSCPADERPVPCLRGTPRKHEDTRLSVVHPTQPCGPRLPAARDRGLAPSGPGPVSGGAN